MKIIVTTSNKYLHILPIFTYLFNKYWGGPCEIVGYAKPDFELPDNFTFHSMGKQGSVKEWSTDLRKYFEQQDEWFIWMMEDTFIKEHVNYPSLYACFSYTENRHIGRINLTREVFSQEYEYFDDYSEISTAPIGLRVPVGAPYTHRCQVYKNTQTARYRLSTQPSIWNKDFLLQYLKPGLTPWQFETQDPINDGWEILGLDNPPLVHNEGVRRFDIYDYNLHGMCDEDVDYINNKEWLK